MRLAKIALYGVASICLLTGMVDLLHGAGWRPHSSLAVFLLAVFAGGSIGIEALFGLSSRDHVRRMSARITLLACAVWGGMGQLISLISLADVGRARSAPTAAVVFVGLIATVLIATLTRAPHMVKQMRLRPRHDGLMPSGHATRTAL